VLNLKRHKQFKKDLKRVNLTDKQFEKFIKYIYKKIQRESPAFKSGDESHTKTFEFKPLQNKL